jgi:hypothetical protein
MMIMMAQPHEVVLKTMIFLFFSPTKEEELIINPLAKPNRPPKKNDAKFHIN